MVLGGSSLPDFPQVHRLRERLRRRLRVKERDDFFLVWGPEEDCRTAADEIRLRFADATGGVPKETRKALPGGLTTFERILPGPDRMYPDTDSPPTRLTAERVAAARRRLLPGPWEREARYGSWGVPLETTHWLIRRGGAAVVDAVVEKTGAPGRLVAMEIGQGAKALARKGVPAARLGAAEWTQVFDLYTDGRLPREAIRPVAEAMALHPGVSAADACLACGVAPRPADEWRVTLGTLSLARYRGGEDDSPEKRFRFLAGEAVHMLRGTAPAREVVAFVRAHLEEVTP